MKLNEMEYIRPDFDEVKVELTALIGRLKEAKTFEEADAAFADEQKISSRISTAGSLVYIRHSVNTLDEYYAAEQDFIDENEPVIAEYFKEWTKALLTSAFRSDFEKKYGSLFTKNAQMELDSFSPEIIPLLQEENKLVSGYEKLLASAQIEFNGGVYTVPQLLPFKESPDTELRHAAWEAEGNFYKSHKDELDVFYDKLVKVRDEMGRKLGFVDFTPLGYLRMQRNSYTKEDISKFREAVVKYIVPVADRLYKEDAARRGTPYPMCVNDTAPVFPDGNAKPAGDADYILAVARDFYHSRSKETAEFIDFMYDNELLDVLSKKGKAQGGYCTGIPDYRAPFIFANFNGTSDDVETMTHEAGHAFAGYTARNVFPLEAQSPTLESCEIHSMSMEFFAWEFSDRFYGKDENKFRYQHLAGALKFIPYGTMVDHFQHIMYEKPSLTPAERDEEWKKLTAVYMPWIKLGGVPFYGDGCAWQRQHHIYSFPFYYIDYCLAQTVALEFWALMQKDMNGAWSRYMKLVECAGTKTFTGLVETAGLDSPFGEKALETVASTAEAWLDSQNGAAL